MLCILPPNEPADPVDQKDEHLLTALRASDKGAFRVLFEKYQPLLFRHAVYMLHDDALAHDITQETFLRVWQHRASLRPQLPFYPYLLRISRNLMSDHVKHEKVKTRYQREASVIALSEGDDPEQAFRLGRLEEEIVRVVNANLGDRCRTIFLLSRIEGRSNPEIAAMLDISIKTVNNHITRALKTLRKELLPFL